MPRDAAHYDLTAAEKRDLVKLIEQGKHLPEKFRFLLFEDKREVELVWNGKTREVCTAVLRRGQRLHICREVTVAAPFVENPFILGGRGAAPGADANPDPAVVFHRRGVGRLHRDHGQIGTLELAFLDREGGRREDVAVGLEVGERLEQAVDVANADRVAVVVRTNEQDARQAVVRQVVGEGTDRLPPLFRRVAGPRLLALDTVRFGVAEQDRQLGVTEAETAHDWVTAGWRVLRRARWRRLCP